MVMAAGAEVAVAVVAPAEASAGAGPPVASGAPTETGPAARTALVQARTALGRSVHRTRARRTSRTLPRGRTGW